MAQLMPYFGKEIRRQRQRQHWRPHFFDPHALRIAANILESGQRNAHLIARLREMAQLQEDTVNSIADNVVV